MLIARVSALAALILASCATAQPPAAPQARIEPAQDIRYVSSDLRHVLVFSRDGARFGDSTALARGLWPSHPAVIVAADAGVQCVSIGPAGRSVELAIKRPLRAGDRYRCLRTAFRVTRCFADCRAALVEIAAPASGNNPALGPIRSSMYVDGCLGLVAYRIVGGMAQGIPFDALWLRGPVGVLADRNDPGCEAY